VKIRLAPDLAFGKFDLLPIDDRCDGIIPAWLIDRPDVLQALLVLSKGGIRAIQTPNSGDLEVDVGIGTISLIELE
jgi:hypothetical protein